MTKSEIFIEAHRRTKEQSYKPAGYRKTFASHLRMVIAENKKPAMIQKVYTSVGKEYFVSADMIMVGLKTKSGERVSFSEFKKTLNAKNINVELSGVYKAA